MAAVVTKIGTQALKALSTPQGQAAALALAGVLERSRQGGAPAGKQQQAPRRPRKSQKQRQREMTPLSPQRTAMEVCAITNPFCDESKGSKWPDGSSAYSVALPVRFRVPVTASGDGTTNLLFTSNYSRMVYRGAYNPLDTNIMTSWDGVSVSAPAFLSQADGVRLVSGGIKFTSTLSPMEASGSVTFIELPPNDLDASIAAYLPFDVQKQNRATYVTQALRDNNSMYSIFRPQGTTARAFQDTNDPDAAGGVTFSTFDWTSLVVHVEGAPTTRTVGFVDVFLNYEVSFDASSDLSVFAQPAPIENKALVSISQNITRVANVYRGDDKAVDDTFMAKASRALSNAGSFLLHNAPNALRGAVDYMEQYQSRSSSRGYTAGASLLRGPTIRMISDHPM